MLSIKEIPQISDLFTFSLKDEINKEIIESFYDRDTKGLRTKYSFINKIVLLNIIYTIHIKNLMEYYQWVTTSTDPSITKIDYDYITSHKLLYGIHEINVIYKGIMIKANAKFDTGARTSSIDINLAKRLGVENEIIEACKELEKVKIPRDISDEDKEALEIKYTQEYTQKYPGISSVQISKSASGFTIRPYIRLHLEFNGRYIDTEANLKDRTGLKAEMLVGLQDML